MTSTSIDLNTLKTIMAFMKPAPVAPVLPLAPLHDTQIDGRISMAKDISYMKDDIRTINESLKTMANHHISKTEFNEHIATDNVSHIGINKLLDDHETRVRTLEQGMWKLAGMSSVGSAALTMGFAYALKLIN